MDQSKKRFKVKPILITLLVTVLILIVFVGIFGSLYIKSVIEKPMSSRSEKVELAVQEGEGTRDIAENLEHKGLIKSSWIFIGYLKFSGGSHILQAGDYLLDKQYTMAEIAKILTEGRVTSGKVTIPEGLTNDQIGVLLQKNKIGTKDSFHKTVSKGYSYEFLKESPKADLQGFLFPNTYFLTSRPTSEEVVGKMLAEFKDKADPVIRLGAGKNGLTYYQTLILASIVEKEVQTQRDKKKVAGIFLKRMSLGMELESCATVQYVLGNNKRILSAADLTVDSPYNTYMHAGLPPAPIANPGIDSIEAVLHPEHTNYLYFFSGSDGKTHFSSTNEEHEALQARYL